MDLAANGTAAPAVRSAATEGLRNVMKAARLVPGAHSSQVRDDITRFLNRPADVYKKTDPLPTPAGEPIGSEAAVVTDSSGAHNMSSPFVSLSDITAARQRIAPIAKVSPLVDVTESAGRSLWLKCESLQPGGAFKIRGAYNMVSQLTDEQRRRGVITYSSGNHGQAVALAARNAGRAGGRRHADHRAANQD